MIQRELTAAEVSDLLNRNFELQGKVLAHQRILSGTTWDQVRMNTWDLPIPVRGISYRDENFGLVAVFPDASGRLHFSGFVSSNIESELAKPTFESPSGNTLTQLLTDFQRGLQTSLGQLVAALVIGGIVYIIVVR